MLFVMVLKIVLLGVRLGSGFRVATERRGKSAALYVVRGADDPTERSEKPSQAVHDDDENERRETGLYHRDAIVQYPEYGECYR